MPFCPPLLLAGLFTWPFARPVLYFERSFFLLLILQLVVEGFCVYKLLFEGFFKTTILAFTYET